MTVPKPDKAGRTVETLLNAALMILVLSVFLGASEAHCADVAKPAAIYLSVAAADLGSTEWAKRNGAVEGNPFMQEHATAKKLVLASTFLAADLYLQKKGKRKEARALRITYAAVGLVAVVVNVGNARRER